MSRIDAFSLDGHALRLFLAVLEEGSVTAAGRLGLSQSAASHGLIRLRGLLGDPLFVKSGRGIVATPYARGLAGPAQALLDGLQGLVRMDVFTPASARIGFTIAANGFQRDLLLPGFFARVEAQVARLSLRVVPSGAPSAALLREQGCDLIITPFPPAGTDILQKRLLTDRYACFYDAAARRPPETAEAYLAARHITVLHPEGEALDFDRRLEAEGLQRDIAIRVPGFDGVAAFLRGSAMLATLPGLLRHGALRGLAHAPVPLPPARGRLGALPLYMAWHRRDQQDARHAWLRGELQATAAALREAAPDAAP
ncbi:LysR family transcriptional regulator [Roseomonas sp. KE0001]|uniref:LysR family transcriptional regulator n=1 Tax=Roseomonas sp. KE0001 TaxID=2479201 RepID=UPI0018DEEF7A|nr:LysR family transcriptional regulator [Roseomonas sp. KE0001]MBI0433273.1 LysR family transcriptional regulator [Roseomonas sp. KE0001]